MATTVPVSISSPEAIQVEAVSSEALGWFEACKTVLAKAKRIALTVHVNPDGDALGSMLALAEGLRQWRTDWETIDTLVSGKIPDTLLFLHGSLTVRDVMEHPELGNTPYDVAICLDCGTEKRLGEVAPIFRAAKTSINMDHHVSNDRFGTINVVITHATASGEVVLDFLDYLGVANNPIIAQNVYTALITDTGGFRYSNTTVKTHVQAARCLGQGIDHERIYKAIYEDQPKNQKLLLAQAIANAHFDCHDHLAWTSVSLDQRQSLGLLEEHCEGVVDHLRQIQTVWAAAIFKEADDGVKVSLRSDYHGFSVADVAAQFGGGGHTMASGCFIRKPLAEAEQLVITALKKALMPLL